MQANNLTLKYYWQLSINSDMDRVLIVSNISITLLEESCVSVLFSIWHSESLYTTEDTWNRYEEEWNEVNPYEFQLVEG